MIRKINNMWFGFFVPVLLTVALFVKFKVKRLPFYFYLNFVTYNISACFVICIVSSVDYSDIRFLTFEFFASIFVSLVVIILICLWCVYICRKWLWKNEYIKEKYQKWVNISRLLSFCYFMTFNAVLPDTEQKLMKKITTYNWVDTSTWKNPLSNTGLWQSGPTLCSPQYRRCCSAGFLRVRPMRCR